MSSRIYIISNRSDGLSGQHGTMYDAVLKFLKDIQIGDIRSEHLDSCMHRSIETLCGQFRRLKILKVKVQNKESAEP